MTKKYFTTNIELTGWKGHDRHPCRVDMTIDLDRLFLRLGNKAFRNKSKRSTEISGLVICEVRPAATTRKEE